jgi:prepilin signal peptidase PulO-like enzyme (type II secretory pathway)
MKIIALTGGLLLKIGSIDRPFPFGPHLVLAGWIVLMYSSYGSYGFNNLLLNFDFIRLFK